MWREFEAESDVVDRLLRQGSTAGEERAVQRVERVEQGRLRSADAADPDAVTSPGRPT
jgi:hypothetical protein